MYHMPIDVIATFNTLGKIKPNYIRIEDEKHTLQTLKVESIESTKEEKYGGMVAEVFTCNVKVENCMKLIRIKYHVQTHQWVMIPE